MKGSGAFGGLRGGPPLPARGFGEALTRPRLGERSDVGGFGAGAESTGLDLGAWAERTGAELTADGFVTDGKLGAVVGRLKDGDAPWLGLKPAPAEGRLNMMFPVLRLKVTK